MKKNVRYKVWVHLEEIYDDEDGNEQYENADELILPLPISIHKTVEAAESVMSEIHTNYWNEQHWKREMKKQ